ncbi:MAG: radical SAM protein [Magnetococcales bacterium]|nr:radical SAM protein [Magnetococcales bacterium]
MIPLLPSWHLARAIVHSHFNRTRPPYKLTFAITHRCNSRCLACDIWKKSEPPEPLSLEEITRFFQKNPYFSWIDLTGGEPFLRPDLPALTQALLRHSSRLYHLHLPTNAVAPQLVIQRVQEILAQNPARLTITLSLDGPETLHDTLRGVTGNWQHALEIWRHFQRHPDPRLQLFFGYTLSDLNLEALTETMRQVQTALPGLDSRVWHMNIAHHSSHYYANSANPLRSPENQAAFVREITAFRAIKRREPFHPIRFLELCYLDYALAFIRGKSHPMPCRALRSSLFLAPDGTVFPCSIWDRPAGNLRAFDFDLRALLASSAAQEITGEIRASRCPGCWTPCDAYPTILGNLPLAFAPVRPS